MIRKYHRMKNWKQKLQDKSTNLMLTARYSRDEFFNVSKELSWGDFVRSCGGLDVKCDLTMKQCREWVSPVASRQNAIQLEWLSESLASVNVVQFVKRINYRVYKNAHKRYGKKLQVVSCIEGGRKDLRMTASWDNQKRLHAHIAIQKPLYLSFDQFKKIIEQEWLSTEWGYNEMIIEPIDPNKRFDLYQVKTGFDAVLLDATHLQKDPSQTRTQICGKRVH